MSDFQDLESLPNFYPPEHITEGKIRNELLAEPETMRVFVINGVAKPSTLRWLANNLDYEVSSLVGKDNDSTAFVIGRKSLELSLDEIEKLGLENFRSKSHNHPHGPLIPSPRDLETFFRPDATYIVYTKEGVVEYRGVNVHKSVEGLYRHMLEAGNTLWRQGENYFKELRKEVVTDLEHDPVFLSLSEDKKKRVIDSWVETRDFSRFFEFFLEDEESGHYPKRWEKPWREYLEGQEPQVIRFFTWDQESEIERILQGETSLTSVK